MEQVPGMNSGSGKVSTDGMQIRLIPRSRNRVSSRKFCPATPDQRTTRRDEYNEDKEEAD